MVIKEVLLPRGHEYCDLVGTMVCRCEPQLCSPARPTQKSTSGCNQDIVQWIASPQTYEWIPHKQEYVNV